MRGWTLAAIFLMFCATEAFADNPAQKTVPTITNFVPPSAINAAQPSAAAATLNGSKGNNCAATHYPQQAIRLNHEGNVVLTVHIDDKGSVSGADVSQSSGWPELDDAAKQCVTADWHFIPAKQDGKAVASSKQYRIVWKLEDPNYRPWLKMDPDNVCGAIFASAKIRWPSYRAATLEFRVSPTGAVEFPFAAISSGDQLFDAKAIECMTKLAYAPAILNGVPSEISWSAGVMWSAQTGLAFADSRNLGPYCPDSDFPQNMWKNDPPNSTEISFLFAPGGTTIGAAIEQASGNPELDQAALTCMRTLLLPPRALPAGAMPRGNLVRFNWRQGHAFILNLPGN